MLWFVVRCLLLVNCCVCLVVLRYALRAARCALLVVGCWLTFAVHCVLLVACGFFLVVCSW